MMWGTPGAEGGMPMEMTPNGGMMMDPNATGDATLAGGRPSMGGVGRGTRPCIAAVRGASGPILRTKSVIRALFAR